MPLSPSRELTEEFYEWEQLGSGNLFAANPVELEPPFTRFFRHGKRRGIIDDGVRPHLFGRIAALFAPPRKEPIPAEATVTLDGIADDPEPSHTIYTVAIPKAYQSKGDSIEQFLTIVAMALTPVSFEIIALHDRIVLEFAVRDHVASFFYTQLRAYFPECTVIETEKDPVFDLVQAAEAVYTADFGLREEFMRPIQTFAGGSDPYTSLFSAFDGLKEGQAVVVQVLFSGTANRWSESILNSVTDGSNGSFFFNAPEMPALAANKVSRTLLAATMRIATFAGDAGAARSLITSCAVSLIHASHSDVNELTPLKTEAYDINLRLGDIILRQSRRTGMLLNTRELATFMHFPAAQLSKKLHGKRTATHPAPEYLDCMEYELGVNEHHGQFKTVGLAMEQRLRHLHVIGTTGVGKSTLLHSLVMQDITNNVGCCVLDPHGDLIDAILDCIPEEMKSRVVLVDPSDTEYPIGLNILSAHSDHERELLASDLVALFKRFSTSWGDQLHSVFANAIMAFLYNTVQGHLGDMRKFLIDKQYRSEYLKTCTDPELAYYWHREYPLLKTSSIGSILTRLDSFLRPRIIRNMICQNKSLNFQELIDNGNIILVKLSQGLIGEENSYLLGALIVARLQQAAMARQQQAAAERLPFFCYIDEFHHFITPSMSAILSGARKFSFGLVLAHQDMQQVAKIDTEVAHSILSNASTRICFRLGDTDAKKLQDGFAHFSADDLQNLRVGEALVRVQTNDADFNIAVFPWEKPEVSYREEILNLSRTSYSAEMPQHPQPDEAQQVEAVSVFEHVAEPVNTPVEPPKEDPPPQAKPREQSGTEADGLREHRYLQTFIKGMGQSYGYVSSVEVKTPNGAGQVDVLLQKGNITVAFEISVANTVAYEMANLKKCLAAGYTQVVVCCPDEKKLSLIERTAKASIGTNAAVSFVTPKQIPSLFLQSQDEPPVTTKKGYRVKVRYENNADAQNQELLKSIVSAFRKP